MLSNKINFFCSNCRANKYIGKTTIGKNYKDEPYKNVTSEITTPTSIKKACLMPLEILVSSRIKNNGPKENESNIPRGIAGNISNIY